MADSVSLPLSYTVPKALSVCISKILLVINSIETKLARVRKKAIQWRPLESKLEWNHPSQSSSSGLLARGVWGPSL